MSVQDRETAHETKRVFAQMRFSVIIPVYNKGQYVKKALESVLSQTWPDYELIVVDDGSMDDSLSIVKSVLGGSTIYYQIIHQENAGVSTARNNGVAASHGDYLCFLDADDWWTPSFLEKMDRLICDYPDAGIYGVNYYIVQHGESRVAVHYAHTGYINYCQSYRKLQMPLWTGAVCIPHPVFSETGGFKPFLKLGEDFDVWIRIALKYKVAFSEDPLAFYNQDVDPQWRGVGRLTAPEFHMLWNLDYLADEEKNNPDYKRLIDELRTLCLLPYYLSKQYREAAKSELKKVDWSKQPAHIRRVYGCPLFLLKSWFFLRKAGSFVKQRLRH